jgi:hypothetical protein
MKEARENYRDPREGKKLSRRELGRRLYMSHSNLADYAAIASHLGRSYRLTRGS